MLSSKVLSGKKVLIGLSALMLIVTALLIGVTAPQANVSAAAAGTSNLASTYTKYITNVNFWSALPESRYKDVYTSRHVDALNTTDKSYQFIDSWQGPRDMVREETVTSGTKRTTSFSGGIEYKCVKASMGYTWENSNSKSVKKTFTFPGDNKLHTLYVTRNHIDRDNYTKRTSYIAYPKSYTYIWGVCYWNDVWGSYSRYSSRDLAERKTADTTEYNFGNRMT